MKTPLDAVRAYVHRGWSPIPVPFQRKAPALAQWQDLRLQEQDLPEHFNGDPQNVGILLGDPSGGLVDVDLDSPDARAVATYFLPDTLKFGRESAQASHWLYRADPLPDSARFQLGPDTLVEIRAHSKGGTPLQTVFPPSVHPSGEAIRFENELEPLPVDGRVLERQVGLLAVACLFVRAWPRESGTRHDIALAVSGALLRAGLSEAEVERFIEAVATVAGDEEIDDRVRAVRDTALTIASGRAATGWPTLEKLMGSQTSRLARRWLGLPEAFVGFVSASVHGDGWTNLEPLPDERRPVQPFDPSLLPETFRSWVMDVAERMQVPADYLAVGIMVSAAAALGRRLGIRPKQRDDWLVIPVLWGMAIGRPGLMKTPALNEVLKPLRSMQAEAMEQYANELADYKRRELVQKSLRSQMQNAIQQAAKAGTDPSEVVRQYELQEPRCRRHIVSDPTVEKLGEILRENPNGVLLFRDELEGFFANLNRKGQEGARKFYLEAWTGNGSYTFDRIGRGTVHIPHVCVSILGSIQPGVLRSYITSSIDGSSGDDGLVQRFQLMVWPDLSTNFHNVDRWPNTEAKATAAETIRYLNGLWPHDIRAEFDTDERRGVFFLRFDAEAQPIFDAWRVRLERRIRRAREHPALISHLAKYRSLVPALALLCHVADRNKGPVGIEALNRAIAWAEYLESHARRVYAVTADPVLSAARRLAGHIVKGDLPASFTQRDVYRKGWAGLCSPEEVERAGRVLEDAGWIRLEKRDTSGRPSLVYEVNRAVATDGARLLWGGEAEMKTVDLTTDKTDKRGGGDSLGDQIQTSVGFVSLSACRETETGEGGDPASHAGSSPVDFEFDDGGV